jgi:RND family efflux transporter MFP subunit
MKKKLILFIALAALLLPLGASACTTGSNETIVQEPYTVARGDVALKVTGDGKIEATREARLTFGSGGKVADILVKEGDRVATGDVLARLDTKPLELALEQSRMSLAQAQGSLVQAQLAVKTAEYNLETTRGSADSLQLALLNAQIARDTAQTSLDTSITSIDYFAVEAELNRAKAWYDYAKRRSEEATSNLDEWLLALDNAEDNVKIAQTKYDNILAGYDSSQVKLKKKQLDAAELSVSLAQKNIDDLDKTIALQEFQASAAEQAVGQAQQAVDLAGQAVVDAQRQLDEATISAPFDGMVAQLLVDEGDIVPSPSMAPQPVVRIIDPNHLELLIDVDEIDIPHVSLGQAAIIKLDALPDQTFSGTVTSIYPVPQEVSGVVLYKVRVGLNNAGSGIKVGMSASADIVAQEHRGVLVVPSRAISQDAQGRDVVKVRSDGKIEERVVEVGLDDGLRAEITSGLSEGEVIIVEVKKSSSGMSLF